MITHTRTSSTARKFAIYRTMTSCFSRTEPRSPSTLYSLQYDAYRCSNMSAVQIWKFENLRRRTAAILTIEKKLVIFKTVWPILTKFCTMTHISLSLLPAVQKFNLKSPRWRTGAIFKNVKSHVSANVWPIFWWHLVWQCILALPSRWVTKNLKNLKI